ncbi:MAG: DUF6516 family protein [Burkholderiaceae bacterium]|nr:DUF6516 family protein [Burkholderiaceae bacterium]
MKARRIFYDKALLPEGFILEMVIWQLPEQSKERPHGLKYRLFYGRNGVRMVGYDNERVKGDHKHIVNVEMPYGFTTVEQLVMDFLADVEEINRAKRE